MSLVSMSEMLVRARRDGCAVGAFEIWNLESIQAVVGAAEGLAQPVILQVGPGEAEYARLEAIADMAIFHALRARIPIALHLDHGDTFERVMQCIHHGFTSVMLDVSHVPYAENVAATREVVRAAHACGVSVEGEMDRIGGGEAGVDVADDEAQLTNPDQALDFVTQTGIDAFAVAIGTVHGFYKGKPNIRLGLLERIAARVSVPLVLHGGSGTPDADVRKAVTMGIAKVNICTEFVAAFADTFVKEHAEPDFRYNVPGVFIKPREAARIVVEKKIRLFAGL